MPAIPRPGESVASAVARQNKEGKKRAARANTARRNRGGKAPAPPKPKARGPLLTSGATPVIKTGIGSVDRQSARRAERKDSQYRRNLAVSDYTSKTKTERAKEVTAAEKRVGTKAERPNDQYVLDAHYRRTRQQNPKVGREKVAKANSEHDREVAERRSRLAALAETQKKDKGRGGILGILEDAVDSLPGGRFAREAVKGSGAVAAAVGSGVRDLGGKLIDERADQPGTGVLIPKGKAIASSVTGDPGRVIGGLGGIVGNTVQAVGEDPKVIPKTAAGVAKAVKDSPIGAIESAKNPGGILPGMFADWDDRFGWSFSTDEKRREEGGKQQRDRMKKDGAAPELFDALAFSSGLSAVGTKLAGSVARRARPGGKIDRLVNAERPALQVAPGVKKPQRKAAGIGGIVAQRTLDKARARKTTRQLEDAVEKRKTPITQKERDRRADPTFGRGVRGWVPDEDAVVPLRRGRGARKQVGRVSSTGFRRMDRLSNRLSRDAGRRFRALSVPEQRVAVLALEGLANPSDVKATLAMVRSRLNRIDAERKKIRTEDPDRWEREYQPLVEGNTDEARVLRDLEADLVERPGQVLTQRLTRFVEGEKDRRPAVEQVGTDSMRPETMLARRFAPAGQTLGTRAEYETNRAAVARLDEHADAQSPVAAALEAIDRDRARVTGADDMAALEAEASAVQTVAHQFGTDQPGIERAKVGIAELFVDQTRKAAADSGLGPLDPVYVLHRRDQGSTAGSFSAGGGEMGAVAPSKRTDMRLFDTGFRDMSASGYELGIQSAIKRSVQWRMVQEIISDFVPEWGKNEGKGFTWAEFQSAISAQQKKGVILDPQDWTVWTPKREQTGWSDRPDALDEGMPVEDLGKLGEPIELEPGKSFRDLATGARPEWAGKGQRFYLIPKDVLGEMRRGGPSQVAKANRYVQKFTALQTAAILGSMPTYAIRQILQNVPMVVLSVGGKVFDPVFYRSLRGFVKAKRINPEGYEDMLDILGVRSKSADAVRFQRSGSTARDLQRFETSLTNSWGGLFGGTMKDYFVAERHSGGTKGKASQAGRTVAKVGFTPFRAMRDFNVAVDQFQDRWARLLALAAHDARMSKKDADQFGKKAAQDIADNAQRMGPLAGALQLPPDELAKLVRTTKFRRQVEDAADGVTKWLGDYSNYTQAEQRIGRAVVPFYGFARHSLRLLAYTLPIEHPLMFAMLLQQAEIAASEKEALLKQYAGKNSAPPEMLPGLLLVAKGDGDLGMVDTKWLNPLTGPAFEVLDAAVGGSNPAEGATSMFTPLLGASVEALSGTRTFTQQRLETGAGQLPPGEKLGIVDWARLNVNRTMGSLYPYRALNELANGEKGKLADTSLLWSPQPVVRKKGGDADKRNRKRIKRRQERGGLASVLDMTVPLRTKPADTLIESAKFAGEKKNGKKSKPKKSLSDQFGGGSGGLF